jgi:hypothetical protein
MYRRSLLILLPVVSLIAWETRAQCKIEEQIASCTAKMHVPMHFLKSYRIEPSHPDRNFVEYSYVLAKDRVYALDLCTEGKSADGLVVTVFDSERNVVVSNETQHGLAKSLVYNCTATGIFYMRYTFESPVFRSCVSVLMFSMNEKTAP